MSRNLKVVGLAVIATLALSAAAASAAHANNVTAKKYPANLVGSGLATEHGKLARLTVGAVSKRFIECTTSSLHAALSGATTAVTVDGTFSNCFSNGLTAVPVTVTMNTCDFVFEATSTTTGQGSVKCETAGDAIEVHVYESEARHKENKSMCTYTIGPQGPITGIKISHTNGGTETEDLDVNLSGSATFTVGNTVGPVSLCGIGAGNVGAGVVSGEFTITGESGGVHTAVMI